MGETSRGGYWIFIPSRVKLVELEEYGSLESQLNANSIDCRVRNARPWAVGAKCMINGLEKSNVSGTLCGGVEAHPPPRTCNLA